MKNWSWPRFGLLTCVDLQAKFTIGSGAGSCLTFNLPGTTWSALWPVEQRIHSDGLVKKSSSVQGRSLESVEMVAGEWRMMAKLSSLKGEHVPPHAGHFDFDAPSVTGCFTRGVWRRGTTALLLSSFTTPLPIDPTEQDRQFTHVQYHCRMSLSFFYSLFIIYFI